MSYIEDSRTDTVDIEADLYEGTVQALGKEFRIMPWSGHAVEDALKVIQVTPNDDTIVITGGVVGKELSEETSIGVTYYPNPQAILTRDELALRPDGPKQIEDWERHFGPSTHYVVTKDGRIAPFGEEHGIRVLYSIQDNAPQSQS